MSREDGIECPDCGCRMSYVQNTYKTEVRWRGRTRTHVRRRRICRHCGLPFRTVEVPEDEQRPGVPDTEGGDAVENATDTPPDTDAPQNPYLPE